MDSVVATVSGYHGSERFKLIKLISQAGASYVGAMNPSTTHLVCRKFEGKKYELAKKFKIIVVNHQWIEDCIKQERRVPERPYTKHCGLEVGPLLLEIPACNLSKIRVIDVECGENGDDAWIDSWLLKENLLPDPRQNEDRSNRLKKKGTKRKSRHDASLDESPLFGFTRTEYEDLSCPSSSHQVTRKRRSTIISESSHRNRKPTQKNICNEANSSSDSEDDCQPIELDHHDIDNTALSKYAGRHKSKKIYKNRLHDHVKRQTSILDDLEKTEGLETCNLADPDNGTEYNPRLSTPLNLSCVICWTDFSSTRGLLPCGHRFCFSCIQNWADHMASMKKVSTCPLCKASFYSIQKMDDAVSSDQKIYSQTIPNESSAMDVYILPHGEAPKFQTLPQPRTEPVCYQCSCREPEELLVRCHICEICCVHSYCLDPPQIPWVCVQCKDLRMRYVR